MHEFNQSIVIVFVCLLDLRVTELENLCDHSRNQTVDPSMTDKVEFDLITCLLNN